MFTIPIHRDFTQFIFSGKNYFDATWCIIGTSKYLAKKKKTIIVRNTNLVWCLLHCLFCLSELLLLPLPWWLSSPLLPTLPSTTGSTPGIARNFTHRFTHCHLPNYYFTARYFTHDQCGEWKNSDFRGEISYFTHELCAQNCLKTHLCEYSIFFFFFFVYIWEGTV